MTKNLSLGKNIVKEIVDDGYPTDPSDHNIRHVHLGDLEAIIVVAECVRR